MKRAFAVGMLLVLAASAAVSQQITFSGQIRERSELDVWASWKLADAVNMSAGYSVFDGAADRVILTGRKTSNWAFVMTTVSF